MIGTNPSTTRAAFGLPILRVNPKADAIIVAQSQRPLFFDVHWFKKALICSGEGCPVCADNLPRTKGFFIAAVKLPSAWQPVIVESPVSSLTRIHDRLKLENIDQLTGQTLRVHRTASNRPLQFEVEETQGPLLKDLMSDHRLISAIAVLHGLPLPQRTEALEVYAKRAQPVAANLLIAESSKA